VAQRMVDTLTSDAVDLGVERVVPRASIGVAWSNGQHIDADSLVARADQAMYESKRQRLGRPVLATCATEITRAA
jgi:GGDEF domain-containing protein